MARPTDGALDIGSQDLGGYDAAGVPGLEYDEPNDALRFRGNMLWDKGNLYVGPTAPANPKIGDLWLQTT